MLNAGTSARAEAPALIVGAGAGAEAAALDVGTW